MRVAIINVVVIDLDDCEPCPVAGPCDVLDELAERLRDEMRHGRPSAPVDLPGVMSALQAAFAECPQRN